MTHFLIPDAVSSMSTASSARCRFIFKLEVHEEIVLRMEKDVSRWGIIV